MKISYEVEIGEVFTPPQHITAPLNYDPAKHDVFLCEDVKPMVNAPAWAKGFEYRLELKKVRTSRFFAYASNDGTIYGNSLTQAWNWTWTKGKTTKFVVEHIYENDILIDMIVHKDPKG